MEGLCELRLRNDSIIYGELLQLLKRNNVNSHIPGVAGVRPDEQIVLKITDVVYTTQVSCIEGE